MDLFVCLRNALRRSPPETGEHRAENATLHQDHKFKDDVSFHEWKCAFLASPTTDRTLKVFARTV